MQQVTFTVDGTPTDPGGVWVHMQDVLDKRCAAYSAVVPQPRHLKVFDPHGSKAKDVSWSDFIMKQVDELGTFTLSGYFENMTNVLPGSSTGCPWVIATLDKVIESDGAIELQGMAVAFDPSRYQDARVRPRMRFSLRRLFAVIVVVAAVGAIYVATVGRSPMSRLFGGGENMAIVREATRVEAYRLGPPPGGNPPRDYISPLDYEVASGPAPVPAEMAKELATTLLSADTYYWGDDLKACGYPVYGVKLSFFRGNDRVDVFFCFQCADLTVTRDGTTLGTGDFNDAKRPFVEAVKALFPDDQEIQQIGP